MFPLPQLDDQSPEPLYRQLHAAIKDDILSGKIARGERIPPTRELAGQLGLNRTTVAAAYELLEAEGLVRGHVGRGSFVDGPAVPAPAEADEINFSASRPSEHLFPIEEFRATCREVIESDAAAAILQLGPPAGYAPLRRHLLDQALAAGVARSGDAVLVTNGCQQALDLIQRTFSEPGDAVLVEDPVYPGLRNIFSRGGVRPVGVPVGADAEVFDRLAGRERARLLIVTPNFQNPTGYSMPLAARQQLLRVAAAHGLSIIENDIYGDLRYTGERIPTLKELDQSGEVIQLKSYSKIAFPGLRVGWVLGPSRKIQALAESKQSSDLHSDQLAQAVMLRFSESGRLEAHRRRMLKEGAARLRAVLDACARHLPAGCEWTQPQGGMNLWLRLPLPLDAGELLPLAQAAHINYLPGRLFGVSRVEPNALRLSFAGQTPERIRAGVAALGQIVKDELSHGKDWQFAGPAAAIV